MTAYLTWTRGLRGASPEKWSSKSFGVNPVTAKQEQDRILSQVELTSDESGLSLRELSEKYPAPVAKEPE